MKEIHISSLFPGNLHCPDYTDVRTNVSTQITNSFINYIVAKRKGTQSSKSYCVVVNFEPFCFVRDFFFAILIFYFFYFERLAGLLHCCSV